MILSKFPDEPLCAESWDDEARLSSG